MSKTRIALFIVLGIIPFIGSMLELTTFSFLSLNFKSMPHLYRNLILIFFPIVSSIYILTLLKISFLEGFIVLFTTNLALYYINYDVIVKDLSEVLFFAALGVIQPAILTLSYVMLRQKKKSAKHLILFFITSILLILSCYTLSLFAMWPTWSILPIIIAHMQSSNNAAEQSNETVTGGT